MKKTIENVIFKNIDARISTLGVSDYKAYAEERNNTTQIVVEIGGVADLEQAKEIIGKTVELEFRLQSDDPLNDATRAERKQKAESIRESLLTAPDQMLPRYQNQGAEDIIVNSLSGTLDQLPTLYQTHSGVLNSLNIGELSPVLDGVYADIDQLGEIKGYTIFRVLERDLENQTYLIEDLFVNEQRSWELAQGNDGNILNGAYFTLAEPSSTEFGQPSVSINFNDKGREIFCEITKNNTGRSMAIFI